MTDTVYSAPRVVGTMRESPNYQTLGVGLTDRLFLIGHADGLTINDPYQVVSIQDAVNRMQANANAPLLRGLLEAYYAGARDIWLIATAPMSEYVPPESRTSAFYTSYFNRLATTYAMIDDWELPQIVVPIEALYYGAGAVDFLTQLSQHCNNSLANTGSVRMGILGTRVNTDVVDFNAAMSAMAADARLATQGTAGRYVSVVIGEGSFNLKEMPTMYSGPLSAVAAGMLTRLPLSRSWVYKTLPNVLTVTGPDLSPTQVTALTEKKLNPVVRTNRGKRGNPFEAVVVTDNTLGTTGTDYWSMIQMRLVMQVIEQVRALSNRYIGTIEFGEYKRAVQNYLYNLVTANVIRGFDVNIARDTVDRTRILVDVMVQPYFGLRQLSFQTAVGPGL